MRVFRANVVDQPPKFLVARDASRISFLSNSREIAHSSCLPQCLRASSYMRRSKGLAQPEIIPVQRQHLVLGDGVENPIREVDAHLSHAPRAGLPDDPPAIDQAEAFGDFLIARS